MILKNILRCSVLSLVVSNALCATVVQENVKPPRASVPRFVEADKIDLNLALYLLQLPKALGEYEGSEVKIGVGRYGPYVFHNGKYVSIPKPEDILTITLDQAIEVLKSKGK